jgi:hypothetical protein
MKCLKGSLVAIVVLLLVGISGTVFAADEAIVDVQITINTKYELTITSGQTVGAMLDSHAVTLLSSETSQPYGYAHETKFDVKTNSDSWVMQAIVTDDDGFLYLTDQDSNGAYTAKIEVSTGGQWGTWYSLDTASAKNITQEYTVPGITTPITVNYRITTTWLHYAGSSYQIVLTYTVTSYNG